MVERQDLKAVRKQSGRMWIFTDKGFLSVVEDWSYPGRLLVGNRYEGDIEHRFVDQKR